MFLAAAAAAAAAMIQVTFTQHSTETFLARKLLACLFCIHLASLDDGPRVGGCGVCASNKEEEAYLELTKATESWSRAAWYNLGSLIVVGE